MDYMKFILSWKDINLFFNWLRESGNWMFSHMYVQAHVGISIYGYGGQRSTLSVFHQEVYTLSIGDRTLDSLTWLDCHPVLDIQLSSAPNTGIKSAFCFIDFLMWVLETKHRCLGLHGFLSNPGSNFLLRGIRIWSDTESPSLSSKLLLNM